MAHRVAAVFTPKTNVVTPDAKAIPGRTTNGERAHAASRPNLTAAWVRESRKWQ